MMNKTKYKMFCDPFYAISCPPNLSKPFELESACSHCRIWLARRRSRGERQEAGLQG